MSSSRMNSIDLQIEECERQLKAEVLVRTGFEKAKLAYDQKGLLQQNVSSTVVAHEAASDNLRACRLRIKKIQKRIEDLKASQSSSVSTATLTVQQRVAVDKLREIGHYHNVETKLSRALQAMVDSLSDVTHSKSEQAELKRQLDQARGKLVLLDTSLNKYSTQALNLGLDGYNGQAPGSFYDPTNVIPVAGDLTISIDEPHDYWGTEIRVKNNPMIEIRLDNNVIRQIKMKRGETGWSQPTSYKISLAKRLWFNLYEKETLVGFATFDLENLLETLEVEEELSIEPAGKLNVKLSLVRASDRYVGGLHRNPVIKQKGGLIGKFGGNSGGTTGHSFSPVCVDATLGECIVCKKGNTKRSFQCKGCTLVCHRGCYSSSSMPRCPSNPAIGPLADRMSNIDKEMRNGMRHAIPHRFTAFLSLAAVECVGCGNRVRGVMGQNMQCGDCSIVCCKKCKGLIPSYCGIPAELLRLVKSTPSSESQKSILASQHEATGRQQRSSDPPQTTVPLNNSNLNLSVQSSSAKSSKTTISIPEPYSQSKEKRSTTGVAAASPEKLATGVVETSSRVPQLDDFTFISVLGRGNFGKVMLAENSTSRALCAIKLIKKHYTIAQDEVESIRTEKEIFEVANRERHPFLVNLYSCFQTDTHLCFVMEYACGGDLMKHIHKSIFGEARGKFYACEILLGLEYLHENGIIYRDLKLDNLLLDQDGHIKIADFGLCKTGMFHDSRTSTFCGTPEFIAPEILKENSYTRAVDWWAFGILIFEMLIGQAPFFGNNEDEIFDAIMYTEIHVPKWVTRKSPESAALIEKLVVKDPALRLGSSVRDAGEIKDHKWFADVDWDDVLYKRIPVPCVPELQDPRDTSNFDDEFTSEEVIITPVDAAPLDTKEQEEFRGFSYHSEWLAGQL
eukprot:CFRG1290T1